MDRNDQTSEERARNRLDPLAFDETPCICAVIDGDHRLVTVNPAFGRLFGEHLGEPCYRVAKGRDAPCPECVALLALAEASVRESDEEGRDRDGDAISFRVRAVPLPGGEEGRPELVALFCVDTTALRDLQQELSRTEQLAEVGLSTALLAHTIKNLVTGLEGGSYVLNVGLSKRDLEKVGVGWEMVRGYVDQVSTLVKNLLQLIRNEGRPPEEVAPADLVREAVGPLEGKATKADIGLEIQVPDGLPPLSIDRAAIRDGLGNLVDNAIDACTWDLDDEKVHRVVVVARRTSDDRLCIEVRDNGPGIAKENRGKVFEQMFSTKGMRGTGLGLVLTRRAVERTGGTIAFETAAGRGTTFRIDLPVAGHRNTPIPQEGVP